MSTAANTTHDPSESHEAPGTPAATASLSDSPNTLGEALRYFLSESSPRVLIAAIAVAHTARGAVGGASLWDLVVAGGLVLYWPLNEWLIHVFVLHSKPRQIGRFRFDPPVPRKHRRHHQDPWNLPLVFIPMHSFLYTLPLLTALGFLLAPTPQLALTGISTYLILGLHYEWVHMLCHTRVVPRSAAYRRLIRNHRLHHFKNEKYWHGVSRLAADRWLGTSPDPERTERSATARTLAA